MTRSGNPPATSNGAPRSVDPVCDVVLPDKLDITTIDRLMRIYLVARRFGLRLRLRNPTEALQDLLTLVGLGEVIQLIYAPAVKETGQAEEGKEASGIQEEAKPADPSA